MATHSSADAQGFPVPIWPAMFCTYITRPLGARTMGPLRGWTGQVRGGPGFKVLLRSHYRHPAQPLREGKKTNVSGAGTRAAHLTSRRFAEMRRDAICG